MKYFFLLLLICCGAELHAQQRGWYLFPQATLLNGDEYVSARFGISGGIRAKRSAFGLGAGIDYYKIRTVPLFAELRTDIGRSGKIYAFAQAGFNLVWPLQTQYVEHWTVTGFQRDAFRSGWIGEAGLGYKIKLAGKTQLGVGLGYSVKTLRQWYNESAYQPMPPYTLETHERIFDYTLNRIALHAGIWF